MNANNRMPNITAEMLLFLAARFWKHNPQTSTLDGGLVVRSSNPRHSSCWKIYEPHRNKKQFAELLLSCMDRGMGLNFNLKKDDAEFIQIYHPPVNGNPVGTIASLPCLTTDSDEHKMAVTVYNISMALGFTGAAE